MVNAQAMIQSRPSPDSARIILSSLLILLLVLLFSLTTPSPAPAQSKKQALLLHSYHQGNKWTDDETKGILSVLGTNRPDFRIEIEYMDTKKVADKRYFRQLVDIYARKYDKMRFDVIIAADDNAFFFIREFRDRLFPGTPVVFCGVNFFKPSYLAGIKGFTGVNEDADLKGAIDTALALHPDTREMVLITDATETGQRISERFRELIPLYGGGLRFTILDDLEMESIREIVAGLRSGSVVLFTFFYRDRAGVFFDYYESNKLITGHAVVPVYAAWDYSMEYAIGGLVVNGFDQGRVAGEIARRILNGESADSIPVMMESPNRYIFDYRNMIRFGISHSALPQGSTIINAPPSFYEINKYTVWGVLSGFISLSLLVVALLVNISSRKKAEEAFMTSEKNYHTLVNNLHVGVYRSAGDMWHGHYLQANPAMLRIYGYDDLEEFLSVPVASLYQDPEERRKLLNEVLAKGYVKDRELAMRRKDGTPITVSITSAVQYDNRGGIKWLDGVMEDVTQQKNLEEQLRQAQKMEAIGVLAGGIAHDFNNILQAQESFLFLIRDAVRSDPRVTGYLDQFGKLSQRAATLTRSLLAYSRRQFLNPRPVRLNDIVREALAMLSRVVEEDIELKTELAGEDMFVMVDTGQFIQALLNLVTNARDAMPHGGMITIRTARASLNRDFVAVQGYGESGDFGMIEIIDTGIGMDDDVKCRAFEPFFTTKEVGKGTGLGLAMVYGTVRQHRGFITVTSAPGCGSSFSLYLPLHVDGKKASAVHAEPDAAVKGSETILLAEDNRESRIGMSEILRRYGYKVIEAADGDEAVRQFGSHMEEISVVLADVVMPKLSGKEAVAKMMELKPGIKVLYMSGYTSDVIQKRGIYDESFNFIYKPASPHALLGKIRAIIDGKPADISGRSCRRDQG